MMIANDDQTVQTSCSIGSYPGYRELLAKQPILVKVEAILVKQEAVHMHVHAYIRTCTPVM